MSSSASRAVWQELLEQDATAVLGQSPQWVDALVATGKWHDRTRVFYLDDDRRFVLPLVSRAPIPRAPLSGFAPSWGVGGPVGPDLDADAVTAIIAELTADPALVVHLRPNPVQGEVWRAANLGSARRLQRRAHVIRIPDARDVVSTFNARTRRQVRRGQRNAPEVRVETGGQGLRSYYDELFLASVERWAEQQNEPSWLALARAKRRDPYKKLQRLAQSLGERFVLTTARVDGTLAAGNVMLLGPNAHYTRGAISEAGKKSAASFAIMATAIETARERGAHWFHMGETGTNEGLTAFKEGFGAVAYDYDEIRIERVPLLAIDQAARTAVKRVIGFRD